jgi:DNA-binding CsgD family transcriptional regulator
MHQIDERQSSSANPVGRDHECRILDSLFEQVRAGYPRSILIGGEAGIGKTTLVDHFVSGLRRDDTVVLKGSCFDVASPLPYGPWREAMSRALETRGPPGASESGWFRDETLNDLADQPELFHGVLDQLQQLSSVSPVALILEDLHWSDPESVELLRYVARSLRDQPVCLIATYRNDEISSDHPMYLALPHLVREARAERLDLRRFPVSVIRILIEHRYGQSLEDLDRLAEQVERKTEGNPFFIVELLRSMEMTGVLHREDGNWKLSSTGEFEVPILIRQVIDQRVRQLDEPAREALQTAAIVGYEVSPRLWMLVSGTDEHQLADSVKQALDAGLMEQSPGQASLRFRHALVQEALYSSVPVPLRQLAHRRTGDVLARETNADPGVVAEHFRQGGDERATIWSLEAARHARKLFAPHAIIHYLDAENVSLDPLTLGDHLEALQLRGWANEVSGDFDAAHRDYLAEYRQAVAGADRRAEWDAMIRLAELWAERDYERAGEYVEGALRIADEIGDEALTAYSLNRLGNWHMNQEGPDRARDHHDRALEIYRRLGDLRGIAATEDLLGMTCTLGGDLVEGTRHYQRAIELFELLDDRQALFSSVANITHRVTNFQSDMMVSAPGTMDECIQEAERAYAIACDIDYRSGQVYALFRLGSSLGTSGDFQRALESLQRGVEGATAIGHRQWICGGSIALAQLFLELLDHENACINATRALENALEIGSRHWIRYTRSFLAIAHLGMGDVEAAIAELEPDSRDDVPARTMAQQQFWRAQIELELLRDDPETALRLVDRVLAVTPHVSQDRPALRLSLLRGRALRALRRHDEALAWFHPAVTAAREQGARTFLWPLYADIGLVYSDLDDRARMSNALSSARAIVDELGHTLTDAEMRDRFLSQAQQWIPKMAVPTDLQSAKAQFGGLTRRQREVASLITAGRSNREIADKLCISERTVETHVTAILSMLNLTSRAQIVAWCVTNGLTEKHHQ